MPTPPRMLMAFGETRTLKEWAKLKGLHENTIRSRIDDFGQSPEQALSQKPKQQFDPRRKRQTTMPPACPEAKEHVTGQAYVRWYRHGQVFDRYLGKWGSPEAALAYRRFAAEWHAGTPEDATASRLTVATLVLRYMEHVERYYVKDGRPTSEQAGFRAALKLLVELFGRELVREMKGRHIKVLQAELIAKRLALTTINQYASRVTRCFRWGVGEDLVPPNIAATLESVPNLQPGRSAAVETDPVMSVAEETVEATLPHLHANPGRRKVLTAMIRFQLLTGCRPGELCVMTPGAITRGKDLWCLAAIDKNLHRQARRRPRLVWIGPKARKVLEPFLKDLQPDERVWSFPPRGKGTVRTRISRAAYGEFIRLACARAKVEPWTPHQLRHTRATQVARIYESNSQAAAAIGDTEEVARTVYVDPSEAVARRIARQTG